ncbi:MAG: type II secretion system protein [Candidatus Paceibacterota bacterium]
MKQKNFNFKNFKGFTLIEMILVVTIIAILATSILVGLGGARTSARNARRVADLRNLQNALELYYNKNGYYCPGSGYTTLTSCLQSFTRVPQDPLSSSGWRYYYQSTGSTNQGYIVGARLEGVTATDSIMQDSLSGVSVEGQACKTCTSDYCIYCVGS